MCLAIGNSFYSAVEIKCCTLSIQDILLAAPLKQCHTVPNLLVGLNVYSNLLRLIRDGGKCGVWGGGVDTYVLPPTRYTVTTRMTALRRAAV